MILCISFSKFSDVLPAFTRARAIGNLWSICLEVNILRREDTFEECTRVETLRSETSATVDTIPGRSFL